MSDITRAVIDFRCEEHGCRLEFNSSQDRITPLVQIAEGGPWVFRLQSNSGLLCPVNWEQTEERGGEEAEDFEDFFGRCKPKWRAYRSELFATASSQ